MLLEADRFIPVLMQIIKLNITKIIENNSHISIICLNFLFLSLQTIISCVRLRGQIVTVFLRLILAINSVWHLSTIEFDPVNFMEYFVGPSW
jgi:hypothetical protein